MTHFPGLPDLAGKPQPLCSTRAEPVTGETTRDPRRITCPDCLRMVGLGEVAEDESERRYP